jgi:hypothetical protein
VRVLLLDGSFTNFNMHLAGVTGNRAPGQPFYREAKHFLALRLLHRNVEVRGDGRVLCC